MPSNRSRRGMLLYSTRVLDLAYTASQLHLQMLTTLGLAFALSLCALSPSAPYVRPSSPCSFTHALDTRAFTLVCRVDRQVVHSFLRLQCRNV